MEPLRPPPVSAHASLLPPPPLYLLYPRPPVVNPSSSTSDHHIESSDGAPKNAQPHHSGVSGKEKEKADNGEEDKRNADKVGVDKEGGDKIGTGVTGISKRTADYEGFDEPGEPVEHNLSLRPLPSARPSTSPLVIHYPQIWFTP